MKKLSEMTLDELWRLFPIFLVEHNPSWAKWYEKERRTLINLLCEKNNGKIKIHHIGSTAIPFIKAKSIVDILIETEDEKALRASANVLEQVGYLVMRREEKRISLNKGYTENGFADRVFHIHLRLNGDNDEVYFRDYLLNNAAIAEEYERLKLQLWKQFEYDRDGYTAAKTEFIEKYTAKAKAANNKKTNSNSEKC